MKELTEYEKRILASAYNLKNYCDGLPCHKCIFCCPEKDGKCAIEVPMYNWLLSKEGDNHEQV